MDDTEFSAQLSRLTRLSKTVLMNRRRALTVMTRAGLVAGGVAALSGRGFAMARQDEGEEPAMATPELGEQPDGTVTWRVQVGHMDMEAGIEVMAFFPEEITVNVGDRIFYDIHSLHTVTFLGDQEQLPFIVPQSQVLGTPAAMGSESDTWILNPMVAFPSGEPVHNGGFVNSGIPDPTSPPFVLEFTEPGTFDYICLVHPSVMKGKVIVQEQGAERPFDQAAYDQQVSEQMETVLGPGQALVDEYNTPRQATPAATGGTTWEVAAGVGEEQLQVMQFLPDRLEIASGDTVRWVNNGGTEPHTVTFPGDTPPPELILVEPQQDGPPMLILNPDVMNPAGGPSYDGQGYANSGWLQEDLSEFPEGVEFPHMWELTFDSPGEYPYYCVLHGGAGGEGQPALVGMVGTIVVT